MFPGIVFVKKPAKIPAFGYLCNEHKEKETADFYVYECVMSGDIAVFTYHKTHRSITKAIFFIKMLLEHGCTADSVVSLEDAAMAWKS